MSTLPPDLRFHPACCFLELQARQVPPLVSRCIADFSAVKQRGARLLNAEGFLTDVSYPDLLKPLWKVAQAIEQATVDEISANERALLEGYEDSE